MLYPKPPVRSRITASRTSRRSVVSNESAVSCVDVVNVQVSSNGVIVQGSKLRLMSKTFRNGGSREYSAITSLLPSGSGGLHHSIPRRKDYGAEGAEMDEAHAAAMRQMRQFSVNESEV